MPRWDAVATFAVVAYVVSALHMMAIGAVISVARPDIAPQNALLSLLALWTILTFSLMGLAIATDVWRKERATVDALILVPICVIMPVLTRMTLIVGHCGLGQCVSDKS